eukprot:gene33865-41776_t
MFVNLQQIVTNASIFSGQARNDAANFVAQLIVTVTDSSGLRSSASTVTLTVLP